MKFDFDLIVVGLGPAGMAVSIMGAEMGLKVCAIEKSRIGGECMNVGCIPSKALLRMAKTRKMFDKLKQFSLSHSPKPEATDTFANIQGHLEYISDKKTLKMFEKVTLVYQKGAAVFEDRNSVRVGDKSYSARRIFICAGTRPAVPDFEGLPADECLTNENLFILDSIPASLIVIGGGAIACEMAQAFARLGSKVTMVIRGPRLMWREDQQATDLLDQEFAADKITILRNQKPNKFERDGDLFVLQTDGDVVVKGEKVLVAAGRKMAFDEMALEKAGVSYDHQGIKVKSTLQTTQPNIYACGDCNGFKQFSHAAMHQGMIALMNSMSPWPMKQNYKKFIVPWTVFTEPQISRAGKSEDDLKAQGINYEVIKVDYADYGAAIAENIDQGFIKAFASPLGKIYGVYVVGEGSGEIINEWALAIQKKIRLHDIMMLQHSFPTMGFLTKRVAETWMMGKMGSEWLKNICRFMFRL